MVKEAPGPINFTTFLSIFGERIAGTDDEPTVLNAFNQFNEGDGKCREDKSVSIENYSMNSIHCKARDLPEFTLKLTV